MCSSLFVGLWLLSPACAVIDAIKGNDVISSPGGGSCNSLFCAAVAVSVNSISNDEPTDLGRGMGDDLIIVGTRRGTLAGYSAQGLLDDSPSWQVTDLSEITELTVGNFDGMGSLDVVYGSQADNTTREIGVVFNGSDTVATEFGTFILTSLTTCDVIPGGRDEFLISLGNLAVSAVMEVQPDGTVSATSSQSSNAVLLNLACADADGDGDEDVFTLGRIAGPPESGLLTLFDNVNGFLIDPPKAELALNAPPLVAVADPVLGALIPAFCADCGGGNRLLSRLDDELAMPADATVDYMGGFESGAMAIGDFNGDGARDLVVANSGPRPSPLPTLLVLLGNGSGSYLPPLAVDLFVGSRLLSVVAIEAIDLNGDGWTDFVVVADRRDDGDSWLSVLISGPPEPEPAGN